MDPGIFELKTEADLLKKLEADLEQARKRPLDSCAWFNFFITAHHLPEWHFHDEGKARDFRKQNHLLRICWELATGGKHYQIRPKPDYSIGGTNTAYVWGPDSTLQKEFVITVTQKEAQKLGQSTIRVIDLAERIVEFFKSNPY